MPKSEQPYIKFKYSKALRARVTRVLNRIDADDDPTEHREELCAMIEALMTAGMQFFFIGPMAVLKMGFVVDQAAALGVAGVQRIMGTTIRNIVARMNGDQLRKVSVIMRDMMD